MADIDRLIEEFAADWEAGRRTDVGSFLERVDPGQRQELAAALDNYLMAAPTRRWDPEAFEGSLAQRASDRVYESVAGVSGAWPELLPRLRNQARIKRRDLVERLTEALGFGGEREIAKVGDYYNRMEHGRLEANGVSRRVIDALAVVLRADAEEIAAAGARRAEAADPGDVAFARKAFPNAEFTDVRLLESMDMEVPAEPTHDEIDALFLDG
ncbi:MAG: hypothetical protein U0R51_01370 [Solirubrobacterales bacterium]